MQLTAVNDREGSGYVALCPQLDVGTVGSPARTKCGSLASSKTRRSR